MARQQRGQPLDPRMVDPKPTPVQQEISAIIGQGGMRMQRWLLQRRGTAAIGGDNRNNRNLLDLLRRLEQLGIDIPQTLSQWLALNRTRWGPQGALRWLAQAAGQHLGFYVADGVRGGFQMHPPSGSLRPSYDLLVQEFNRFGRGTVAELKVLLLFGYTPSDEGRMNTLLMKNRPRIPR